MSTDNMVADTIAAIATPLGYGGIGIVRISGPKAVHIAKVLVKKVPAPGCYLYQNFLNQEQQVIDQGIILYYQKPHSYTREDVIELQGHGSPVVLNSLLNYIITLGARLARPGEFTESAFLNGRLDLAQAEAVHDVIHAQHEKAAQAAMQSLQGNFSKSVTSIQNLLEPLRSEIEAAIDFSEEDIDFLQDSKIEKALSQLLQAIVDLKQKAQLGERVQRGYHVVIAGPPNVGKSSLLNALSVKDLAIVTAVPGTTRDVISTHIQLDSLSIKVVDTAGIRITQDEIESEGIRRATSEIAQADQILWVIDSTLPFELQDPKSVLTAALNLLSSKTPEITIICNKIDLSGEIPGVTQDQNYNIIRLSAHTGTGVEVLRKYLKDKLTFDTQPVEFSARERHILALVEMENEMIQGIENWKQTHVLETLAEHLRKAQLILNEMTGKSFTTENLLGRIFSEFCIGK